MSSFPKLADLRGLPDALFNNKWTLVIASIPGGGDGRSLQLQCRSSSIPGQNNEQVTAGSHGYKVHYAGTGEFSGTLGLSFFETRSLSARDAILGWIKYARDIRAGTGNYKVDYERTAQLILFDDANNPIRTINFEGFFPLTIDEASLDGSPQGQVVEVSSTWSYDSYFET